MIVALASPGIATALDEGLDQTKNQLDPTEDQFYVPGRTRRLFEIKGIKFGVVICHEGWRYREGRLTGIGGPEGPPLRLFVIGDSLWNRRAEPAAAGVSRSNAVSVAGEPLRQRRLEDAPLGGRAEPRRGVEIPVAAGEERAGNRTRRTKGGRQK